MNTKYRQDASIAAMAALIQTKEFPRLAKASIIKEAMEWGEAMLAEEIKRHGEEARHILTALKTQEKLENGYVMVPREPTDEMIQKGWRRFDKFAKPENRTVNMYRAMISSAPTPPEGAE